MTTYPAPTRSDVNTIADDAFRQWLTSDPFGASLVGWREFDHAVPDLSEAADERRAAELDDIIARLDALDPATLDVQERITREVVLSDSRLARAEVDTRPMEFTCGPFLVGAQARVLQYLPKVTLLAPEHAEAYLERCAKVGRFLAQAAERLDHGVVKGRTPPAKAVAGSIAQIDGYLADGLDADPLLTVRPPAESTIAEGFGDRLRRVLTDEVRPAFARFRDHLADIVLPHARSEEHSGLCWLPDGESVYAVGIRRHTTTALSALEIHKIGLDALEGLAEEYRTLAADVLGTSELPEIFDRLRNDPALRFSTSEQVHAAAVDAMARAVAAAPAWFHRLPKVGCEVRAMPAIEAPDAATGYYQPPAEDGSRPGIFWVNTGEPNTRTRFECEPLAFHESLPGHHLQISLAKELEGLPAFRRMNASTAYTEGWALYTERLADEMGLYSGDVSRLGMLSHDSLRACRLVVDTGLHAMGWSRQQAIDFCRANSPQAHNNIDNEIDRYIAMPGQALGYMIGRREIRRLRNLAETTLGDAFDIRDFHDVVLRNGPIPLDVLTGVVTDWLTPTPTP